MSRYEPLAAFLRARPEAEVKLPLQFDQIERILGRHLPPSAREYPAWWSNTTSHSQAGSWMGAGWKTWEVSIPRETVLFVRTMPGQALEESPTAPPSARNSGRKADPEEVIVIRPAQFTGGVRRLLEDYQEENGGDLAGAVLGVLSAAALERRRQLLQWFRANAPPVSDDSAALIREDRDSR